MNVSKMTRDILHKLPEKIDLFDTIFNSSTDGLCILINKEFIGCNDQFLKIFKIKSRKHSKKMQPIDFAPEFQPNGMESLTVFRKLLKKCLNSGHAHRELLLHDTQGTEIWVDVVLMRATNKEKCVIYSIVKVILE